MKNEPQAGVLKNSVFQSAAEIIRSTVYKHMQENTKQPKMKSYEINNAADLVVSKICEDADGFNLEHNKKQRDVLRNQVIAAIKAANLEMSKGVYRENIDFKELKGATQALNKACEYVIGVQTKDKAELARIENKVHKGSGARGSEVSDYVVRTNSTGAADKIVLLSADALKREPKPSSMLKVGGIGEITRKDAQSLLAEQFLFSGIRMFFTHPIRTTMQAFGFAPSRDSITRELSKQLGLTFVREDGNASIKLMHLDFVTAMKIFQDKMQENGAPARFTKNFMLLSEIFTNQESYTQIRNIMEANEDLKGKFLRYSGFVGDLDQLLVLKSVLGNEGSKSALFKYFQDKNFASLQKDPSSYNDLRKLVPDSGLPDISTFKDFTDLKNALGHIEHLEVTKFMSEQLFNKRDFDEIHYVLDGFNRMIMNPNSALDTSEIWKANFATQIQTVADGMQGTRIVNVQTSEQKLKLLEEYADNLLELLARSDAVKYYGQSSVVKKMVDDINSVRDDIINSIYNKAGYNIDDIIHRMGKVGLEIGEVKPVVVNQESHVERVSGQALSQQQLVI